MFCDKHGTLDYCPLCLDDESESGQANNLYTDSEGNQTANFAEAFYLQENYELKAELDAYKAHMAELKIGLEATLDCAISTQACDSILSDAMIDLLAKASDTSLIYTQDIIEITITELTRSPSKLWGALKSGDVRIVKREQKPGGMVIESAIVKREIVKL
ncbi:MAG: hypothetical protein JKY50_22570 [Oleispira sp.]|nr:hypothetical protein [Oleispira sp.]